MLKQFALTVSLLQSLSIFIVFGSIQPLLAKDLGTHAQVFEIHEQSLLELIQERLKVMQKEGKTEAIQKELQQKVIAKVQRPTPLKGITKATDNKKKIFDPTFVVSEDIKDHQGNIIASKGTSHNPLDHKSFGEPLIFIDGDDAAQVEWAISQKGKIVLINGSPLELEKAHNRAFYFDQGAVLIEKFGINQVPTIVRQEEKHLVIETILLTNQKD